HTRSTRSGEENHMLIGILMRSNLQHIAEHIPRLARKLWGYFMRHELTWRLTQASKMVTAGTQQPGGLPVQAAGGGRQTMSQEKRTVSFSPADSASRAETQKVKRPKTSDYKPPGASSAPIKAQPAAGNLDTRSGVQLEQSKVDVVQMVMNFQRSSQYFYGLSKPELKILAPFLNVMVFEVGDILFEAGDPASYVGLLVKVADPPLNHDATNRAHAIPGVGYWGRARGAASPRPLGDVQEARPARGQPAASPRPLGDGDLAVLGPGAKMLQGLHAGSLVAEMGIFMSKQRTACIRCESAGTVVLVIPLSAMDEVDEEIAGLGLKLDLMFARAGLVNLRKHALRARKPEAYRPEVNAWNPMSLRVRMASDAGPSDAGKPSAQPGTSEEPSFFQLSDYDLATLNPYMFVCEFPFGAKVLGPETEGASVNFIISGTLGLVVNNEVTQWRTDGQPFGEGTYVNSYLYMVEHPCDYIVKSRKLQMAGITHRQLNALCETHPKLGFKMLSFLIKFHIASFVGIVDKTHRSNRSRAALMLPGHKIHGGAQLDGMDVGVLEYKFTMMNKKAKIKKTSFKRASMAEPMAPVMKDLQFISSLNGERGSDASQPTKAERRQSFKMGMRAGAVAGFSGRGQELLKQMEKRRSKSWKSGSLSTSLSRQTSTKVKGGGERKRDDSISILREHDNTLAPSTSDAGAIGENGDKMPNGVQGLGEPADGISDSHRSRSKKHIRRTVSSLFGASNLGFMHGTQDGTAADGDAAEGASFLFRMGGGP
ncbi:hypothetical protein CYMTET_45188, partial [Cymbomonas tetramitiformis]